MFKNSKNQIPRTKKEEPGTKSQDPKGRGFFFGSCDLKFVI
jgi:hypothetical protein